MNPAIPLTAAAARSLTVDQVLNGDVDAILGAAHSLLSALAWRNSSLKVFHLRGIPLAGGNAWQLCRRYMREDALEWRRRSRERKAE